MTVDVDQVRRERIGDQVRISFRVGGDTIPPIEVWVASPRRYPVAATGDLLAAFALFPAMVAGSALRLPLPLSPTLARATHEIQEIYSAWYPDTLSVVEVEAPRSLRRPARRTAGTITCFTGGVDSFYTLLTRRSEIDALLFVHGYDIPLEDRDLRARVSAHLAEVATDVGLPLVEVETNVRELFDPVVDWGLVASGTALAAIAVGLKSFTRFLIPASHSYFDLIPRGSHPLTDRLWSTGSMSVVHDGARPRVDKVRRIADDPVVARHLRVCWQRGVEYNCGTCEKCVRTMVTLSLCGRLADVETFPGVLDLDLVADLDIRNESDYSYLRENLRFAAEVDRAEKLRDVLADVERRYLTGRIP
jgi:hypothetical protein